MKLDKEIQYHTDLVIGKGKLSELVGFVETF